MNGRGPINRRILIWLPAAALFAEPKPEKLYGRWRGKTETLRNRTRNAVTLEFAFLPPSNFALQETDRLGSGATYGGSFELTGSSELVLYVSEAPEQDGRYKAGEEVNLGVLEFLSSSRVRVGAMELTKRLD